MRANTGPKIKRMEYSRVIGILVYDMSCTILDIAFVVGMLCRYTSNPGKIYLKGICRVLRYLKGTMDLGLHYISFLVVMESYSDVS